jgi:DNA-binding transcriptional ArsR family regulator
MMNKLFPHDRIMRSNPTLKSSDDEKKKLELQADLCQSLTHPFRLRILKLLENGEKNVTEIKQMTNRPQPFISQHLKVLRDKGFVNTHREANEIYYSLADPKILEICKLVAELASKTEFISD